MTTRREFVACLSFTTAFLASCGGGGASGADGGALPTGVSPTPPPPPSPPPPSPSPAPSPGPLDPPTDPVPAPPSPGINARWINTASALLIEGGFVSSRYERSQRVAIWSESGVRLVEVIRYDFASGGARVPLQAATYRLRINGVLHSTVARTADSVFFEVNQDALPEGWHWLDVEGAPGETTIPLPIYRRRGERAVPQTQMPILTVSQEMMFPLQGVHEERILTMPAAESSTIHFGMVPARFEPTVQSLLPRECPPVTTAVSSSDLVCTQVVPCRKSDLHRPTITADGVMTTAGMQCYHFYDFVAASPQFPLLDGPRGRGTVAGAAHLQVGRGGKIYGVDPWRMFRIDADGTVVTLAGWRQRTPMANYTGPQNLELVGDWSSIPASRHGFHEAWGMAWDERTLTVNESAPPIPSEGNEKPHQTGPVAFISDTQNNRILRIEFSATSRSAPPKVTEFITGLGDPWDCVYSQGVLYVSERTRHRIAAFNATTGAFIRTVISGADLGFVSPQRWPTLNPGVTLEAARAQPCVLPEGLYLRGRSLYFGSRVMEQVREINLDTGTIVRRQNIYCDGNSFYAKIAVSDGTFGPEGTIFVVTWTPRAFGYPHAYLPDGREWSLVGNGRVGTMWGDAGYPTAVGVGQGRLLVGNVSEGLNMVSRALPTDRAMPRQAGAGALEYWRRGYRRSHGFNGWGHYGLPVPWGLTPDIDAFLEYCGHRRA
jgi:hypothetical protein